MARGGDSRHNENRRPKKPISRFDSPLSDNPEMPHGNISSELSDIIKQTVYDQEFNNIVEKSKNDVRPSDEEK